MSQCSLRRRKKEARGQVNQREQGRNVERGAAFSLSRRRFLGLASLAAAGAAAACGNRLGRIIERATPNAQVTDASAETPPRGGTLVVGMAATSIVTLDPAAYSDRATETVVRNIFDGLVTRTVDNEVVPELAQDYRWVDDRTVDFELKHNVTFHNGDQLTSEDVVFSFERILHQAIGAQRRGFAQEVESVQALDTYAVRFNLKSPWPVFLQMLVHNQIVPKEYASHMGDIAFAKEPVGCGPFRFVGGHLDDRVVLERYDGYYGGAHLLPPVAPPSLDGAVFEMIPDADQRIEALLDGEVHIIQNVPPQEVPRLVGVPEVAIKTTVGTRPKFMDLNVTLPPFDDPRVRQALNYAVDADRILTEVAGGYGVILTGPLSPANLYVDPTLKPYGYDPELAISLLSEAGYAPQDISFTIDAYGSYVDIAEAVAEQLRALGMDVGVQTWDYAALRPVLLDCERQAFLRDWGDSAFDPVGYLEAKWQTYGEGTPAGRANYACYSNPRVDELIQAGASEPEPAKRRRIYTEVQRLIREDAPAVFLYVPQEIEAAAVRVHNWQPSPDGRINLHDVWLSEG
jgi:peptide/nickel transport system substrate-binding protein